MKGQKVQESNHIARFCKPTSIENDEIQATAFMMRANDQYLSVNWLEELNKPNRVSEMAELQELYSRKFKVSANARIVVLNVGEVILKVLNESSDRRLLSVLHEPEPNDASHSGIYGIPHDDDMVAELIAQVVTEQYPAKR